MGLLFNKIIPMEMLAEMPVSFVHRLRDIRSEQLKQQHQQQSETQNNSWIQKGAQTLNSAYDQSAIEDLIDEFQ